MRRRRRAERWAARHGALARMAMRDLIQTAVELGMDRHSVLFGKPTAKTRRRERELLERITADRRLIGSLTAPVVRQEHPPAGPARDRKSTRLNSSHVAISYAVFCLKKKRRT